MVKDKVNIKGRGKGRVRVPQTGFLDTVLKTAHTACHYMV